MKTNSYQKTRTNFIKATNNEDIANEYDVDNNEFIVAAAKNGDIGKLKFLLQNPQADPSYQDNKAILSAIDNNHIDAVILLLKDSRFDPSINGENIVDNAVQSGNIEMVTELLEDDKLIDEISSIPLIYRGIVENALRGMIAIYYFESIPLPLYYPINHNTKEGKFYNKLLIYIIIKRPSILQVIEYLKKKVTQIKEVKYRWMEGIEKIISAVVVDILNINDQQNLMFPNTNWTQSERILFNSLKGLLLAAFEPKYLYLEILNMTETSNKEIDIARGMLVGAFMGFNQISKQIIWYAAEDLATYTNAYSSIEWPE
jgi:hypothetical protein